MCSKAGACEEVIKIESNVKTMSSQVAEMHDAMFVSKGDDRAIVELVRDNKKNLERHINDTQQIHLPPKHPEPRKTQEVDISASFKDGFKANFKNINPKDLARWVAIVLLSLLVFDRIDSRFKIVERFKLPTTITP